MRISDWSSDVCSSDLDCRPYKAGNSEVCEFPTPQEGTYHVRVKAYQAYSGVTLVGEYDGDGGGGPGDDEVQTYTNDDDFAIEDRQVFRSPVVVADRSGSGLAETEVDVDITHSYIGDLRVDLVVIGRAHVCTPVTTAQLLCRLLL